MSESLDLKRTLNLPTSKPIIGLLGAPGSGKSLIARQFQQLGCAVIDADQLAREALNEPSVREQLRQWWGDQVVDEAGRVNRSAVGAIVFEDQTQLRRLEALTHPRVNARRQALRGQYQADPNVRAIVEDCPLLLEKQLTEGVDVLVYVDAPFEVRLQRVQQQRGWTAEELRRRENLQWPLDIKKNRADYVVTNHADEAESFDQVRRVLSQITPPQEQR